ncbi:MAG TPA: FMN-binding protein [Candidatus Limiplasma sp.]|nr:FMN-binding protein [Candidatus Limiplasma sp.]HPS81950.1 FMN-binding protein [Candidatus Limiplasma sp.]
MKKGLKILGTVLFVVVCLIGVGFLLMGQQQNEALAKLENVPIDMARVADGVYTGDSDAGMVQAEVRVTVTDHRIADITLIRHQTGLGKPAEATLADMVAQNNYEVDAVTGATASSLTLRNAVNQALRQGLTP